MRLQVALELVPIDTLWFPYFLSQVTFSSLESRLAKSSPEENLYLPLILSASRSGGPNRATFQNAQRNSLETCFHISPANKTVKGVFFGIRNKTRRPRGTWSCPLGQQY